MTLRTFVGGQIKKEYRGNSVLVVGMDKGKELAHGGMEPQRADLYTIGSDDAIRETGIDARIKVARIYWGVDERAIGEDLERLRSGQAHFEHYDERVVESTMLEQSKSPARACV